MIYDAKFWVSKLYLNIILLIFALFLCIVIGFCRKRIRNIIKQQKCKPNAKYVASRLKAHREFNESFDETLRIARTINHQYLRSRAKESSLTMLEGLCNIAGEEVSSINETYEDILASKMEKLYKALMLKSENSKFMKKAIHFEIKQRCMAHPYDLRGSQNSKLIETAFENECNKYGVKKLIETAFEDECNKDGIKSVFSLCYNYLKRYAKQKYEKITKKLAAYMKNECIKTVFLPVIGVCAVSTIFGLGAYFELYLEISLFGGCLIFEAIILIFCWHKG